MFLAETADEDGERGRDDVKALDGAPQRHRFARGGGLRRLERAAANDSREPRSMALTGTPQVCLLHVGDRDSWRVGPPPECYPRSTRVGPPLAPAPSRESSPTQCLPEIRVGLFESERVLRSFPDSPAHESFRETHDNKHKIFASFPRFISGM